MNKVPGTLELFKLILNNYEFLNYKRERYYSSVENSTSYS